MAVAIRPLGEAATAAWDAFVNAHPDGTFFHRAGWATIIEREFGHRTLYAYAERDGVITGVLPLAQVKTLLFGNTLISVPFCVYGGPLAADLESAAALSEYASALLERTGASAVEFRYRNVSGTCGGGLEGGEACGTRAMAKQPDGPARTPTTPSQATAKTSQSATATTSRPAAETMARPAEATTSRPAEQRSSWPADEKSSRPAEERSSRLATEPANSPSTVPREMAGSNPAMTGGRGDETIMTEGRGEVPAVRSVAVMPIGATEDLELTTATDQPVQSLIGTNDACIESDWLTRPDLYVTFRKPIEADHDKNLKSIPRKQRAMVRKGIQNGLSSIVHRDVRQLHGIYAESVRNLGTPVFSRRYFTLLTEVFGPDCDILTVQDGDNPIAAVMNFYFRDEVLPYYGGGTRIARQRAANDFMYWEVMRRAADRGCRLFDFGRSKLGTGAFDFKKNWGFMPEHLQYRYKLAPGASIPDHNPLNPKYQLFIAGWKRLPLAVANTIGPSIVRGLG